jgi:hypothetical protein
MVKYQIILTVKLPNGNEKEIPSILFDDKPTEEQAKEGAEFYKAISWRIEEVAV